MVENIQQRYITDLRLNSYIDFEEYKENIFLSQKYYILLCIFEISLRNSIDFYFRNKISTDWLNSSILHSDTKQKIQTAKSKILQRRETVSHDKIIAELSFGFWTSLFRKSYANLFRINDIQLVFPNLPNKKDKIITRNILDKQLNNIRKFRNRVFHYEKIIDKSHYVNMENDITELLKYFDIDIYNFAQEMIKTKEQK